MMEMENLLNKTIKLPTHFPEPVEVESITQVGKHYKLRVRKIDGHLEEVIVSENEIEGVQIISKERYKPVNSEHLSLSLIVFAMPTPMTLTLQSASRVFKPYHTR